MASQNQKSFISQMTLDSSKINRQSISATLLPPLHAGQSSYIVYKHKIHSKHHSRPLPFGSSSSRITEQLQPKVLSHIVSYGSINSKPKFFPENYTSPFGSTDSRFKDITNHSPGPGLYKYEDIKSIKNSRGSGKFSMVDRELSNDKSKVEEIGPGSYQINEPIKSLDFRQKLAEKFREQRKKYIQILSLNSNKNNEAQKMGSLNNKNKINHHNSKDHLEEKIKAKAQKIVPSLNRFTLKDSTKKYVMKLQQQNRKRDCEPICFIKKNFSYNFIQKPDKAFSSYIPKIEDSPGPGYYPLNKHEQPSKESSPFKSSSLRTLFPNQKKQAKKQKHKLSQLL